LGNSVQESRVLKVRSVAVGFRPTNTEVEYWLYFPSGDPQILETSAQEGHRRHITLQRMFGGDLCKYEVRCDYVMHI